jgi:hypothetical protein
VHWGVKSGKDGLLAQRHHDGGRDERITRSCWRWCAFIVDHGHGSHHGGGVELVWMVNSVDGRGVLRIPFGERTGEK